MKKKLILLVSMLFLTACFSILFLNVRFSNDLYPVVGARIRTAKALKAIDLMPEIEIEELPEFCETLIEEMHDYLEEHDFNGVALVAVGDQVLLLNAYGLANVEQEQPMKVDRKFQIASISKPILAVSVMQLVERDLLALDQTLDEFFPDLPRGDEMTIQQLLTHTSGLFSGDDLTYYSMYTASNYLISYAFYRYEENDDEDNDDDEDEDDGNDEALDPISLHGEPGDAIYSNLGFDLLGVIVEKASGMPYEQYIRQYIFDVAGMYYSGLNRAGEELEKLVTAYMGHIDYGIEAPIFHPSFGFASGGLHSTAMDLFKFSRALHHDLLISPESYELMTSVHSEVWWVDHGFGWFINPRGSENTVAHTGNLLGWHSILLRQQPEAITIVLLTNHGASYMGKAYTLLDLVLSELAQ